jgi:hypothetical protein
VSDGDGAAAGFVSYVRGYVGENVYKAAGRTELYCCTLK